MLVAGDTPGSIAKSIGLGVIGLSDALEALRPEMVILLGDRFEILAAATAALAYNIPIAHIAGGDTTEGAIDRSIRHAVTKMAHLHFVTNALSATRIRQMGENPNHVHIVGSPGLDHIHRRPLLDREALEATLGAPLGQRNLLVAFSIPLRWSRSRVAASSPNCSRLWTAKTQRQQFGSLAQTLILVIEQSMRPAAPGLPSMQAARTHSRLSGNSAT